MGPLRFELRLPTPQAGRIPGYPTVPDMLLGDIDKTKKGSDFSIITLMLKYPSLYSPFYLKMEYK